MCLPGPLVTWGGGCNNTANIPAVAGCVRDKKQAGLAPPATYSHGGRGLGSPGLGDLGRAHPPPPTPGLTLSPWLARVAAAQPPCPHRRSVHTARVPEPPDPAGPAAPQPRRPTLCPTLLLRPAASRPRGDQL